MKLKIYVGSCLIQILDEQGKDTDELFCLPGIRDSLEIARDLTDAQAALSDMCCYLQDPGSYPLSLGVLCFELLKYGYELDVKFDQSANYECDKGVDSIKDLFHEHGYKADF